MSGAGAGRSRPGPAYVQVRALRNLVVHGQHFSPGEVGEIPDHLAGPLRDAGAVEVIPAEDERH